MNRARRTPRSFAYAILAARQERDSLTAGQSFSDFILIETDRLRAKGIRPIWYLPDDTHTRLFQILQQLQTDTRNLGITGIDQALTLDINILFLDRAQRLEELGAIETPTPEQRQEVTDLIRSLPELARHFFQHARGLGWYDALLDRGILELVAEPRPDAEGRMRLVTWSTAPYIEHIAERRPDAVTEMCIRLGSTKNWHAQSTLSRLAPCLQDEQLRTVLPIFYAWLGSNNWSVELLASNLIDLLGEVYRRGSNEVALEMLAALLTPRRGSASLTLPVDRTSIERLRPLVQRFIRAEPAVTYGILKPITMAALEFFSASGTWISRPAIEEHEQNHLFFDVELHALISFIRDALVAWAEEASQGATQELDVLLTSDEELLRRLALHALLRVPALLQAVKMPLFKSESFFSPGSFHETAQLLHEQFSEMTAAQQSLVHRLIELGPSRPNSRPSTEWQQIIDSWRWHYLWVIPEEHLTAAEHDYRAALSASRLPPEELFFLAYSSPVTSWGDSGGFEPAVTLAEEGILGLLTKLRAHDVSWESLGTLVRSDPEGMLELAQYLDRTDFERCGPFLNAYEELMKGETAFSWAPFLQLAERIVPEPPGAPDMPEWAVARLLKEGITNRASGIPDNALARSLCVVLRLIEGLTRPLTSELTGTADLTTEQLNTAAGQAADALMYYLWRRGVALERGAARVVPADVSDCVTKALNEGWGGIEMRHALGQYYRWLEWYQPGWVATHMSSLVPTGASVFATNAKTAFLQGYLCVSQLLFPVMTTLVPLYRDALESANSDTSSYMARMNADLLAEHILVGWLDDIEGFRQEELLSLFWRTADDRSLDHAAWFLWRQVQQTEGVSRDKLRDRMNWYWEQRTVTLQSMLVTERRTECDRFCAWPKELGLSVAEAEQRLLVAIRHLNSGYGQQLLLEYLSDRGEHEPEAAARLLYDLVHTWAPDPEMYWLRKDVEAVISAIRRTPTSTIPAQLRAAVAELLASGRGDFRHLLN